MKIQQNEADAANHVILKLIEETQSFLIENSWSKSGRDFFFALAEYLAGTLQVDYVCIDELLENNEAQTVAVYYDGHFEDNVRYALEDTPCGQVKGKQVCCFPSKVRFMFPKDIILQEMAAESYSGITLWGTDEKPVGLIAVIGRRPLETIIPTEFVLKTVAIRAATELEHRQLETHLRYYANLVENTSEAIISTNEKFVITSWNKAAEKIYGWRQDEVTGQNIISFLQTQYPAGSSRENAARQMEAKGFWKGEVIQKRKDGTNIHIESSVSVIRNNDGNITGIVAINTDISRRKHAEEELQKSHSRLEALVLDRTEELHKSEEKYRTVADFTYDWETWIGPDGKYLYVSPACETVTGYKAEEFIKDEDLLNRICHPDDQEMLEKHDREVSKGSVAENSMDFRIISRSGEEKWIGHNCRSVFDAHGNWIGQRGSNRDITERKKAESELINSQKYLRALRQRVDAIAEEERAHIAREIHDELGHLLTAIKYDIESLTDKYDLSNDVDNELDGIVNMVESLIDSVRKIATELRPGVLDHLGLFPAIEWQIRQFQMRTKIQCIYEPADIEMTFNKRETIVIFRILQEILTNVTRHSKAKKVVVTLNKINDLFILTVSDDGIGFEMKDVYSTRSLGLLGMHERALSIGGEVGIKSQKGKGTIVTFTLTN